MIWKEACFHLMIMRKSQIICISLFGNERKITQYEFIHMLQFLKEKLDQSATLNQSIGVEKKRKLSTPKKFFAH